MAQTFPFLGSKGRAAFAALLHDESPHVWIIGDSSRPRARATPRSFHDSFYGAAIFGCKLRDSAQRGANRKRPKHLASAMLRKLMKTDAKSLS